MPKPTKTLEELVSSRAGKHFLRGNVSPRSRVSTELEPRKDVTVKMRRSTVTALQRAMHERTLQKSQGTLPTGEPYTRQDIVDIALEVWLRAHGYLSQE